MPIGAIIGGVASIGGALIGSSSQKKAAKQANAAQQDATQSQLTLGRESLALNKDIYGQNKALLTPFVDRGNVAGDSINALLGLPSGQAPAAQAWQPGTPGGSGVTQYSGGPLSGTWNADQGFGGLNDMIRRRMVESRGGDPIGGLSEGGAIPGGVTTTAATPSSTPTSNITQPSAMDALNNFSNSAGMQFQLQQGGDMINNHYAGMGALQSGAAEKELQNYGQQTALNNYFMPYMGLLGGQQSVGAGAASAVAGVGTNFGNTAANINAGMGANIQNGANAASNAALLRGQATSQMWNGIGSALGGIASSFGK
jgi:hypothetical protein